MDQMKNFSQRMAELMEQMTESGQIIEQEDVIRRTRADWPAEFEEYRDKATIDGCRAAYKNHLKSMKGPRRDPEQLEFNGMAMPRLLTIPMDGAGSFGYLSTYHATWEQRLQHTAEVTKNFERVRDSLRAENEAFDEFEPIMKDNPEMTFGDAIRIMGDAA